MTKAELIERIARSRDLPPDMTKKDIALILGVAFEELSTYFAKTRVTQKTAPRFSFPRFGTFTKKRRSARRGVNPRTLEPMQIDACHTIDFKASRELRELMNGGTAASAAASRTPKKAAAKSRAKPKKASAAGSARRAKVRASKKATDAASSRRKMTPRDEDAELDALIDDDGLFEELPAGRMQRVRPKRGSKSRRSG